MECYNFNAKEYAESLMLEAGGINSGMMAVEIYCHHYTCAEDELKFYEYVLNDSCLTLEDRGLMLEGMEVLEELVNPSIGQINF